LPRRGGRLRALEALLDSLSMLGQIVSVDQLCAALTTA
jgi:hypothetical protein